MPETTVAAPPSTTPGKSLAARILGIVFSPYEAYADVATRPRVLGALLFVLALNLATAALFSSSQVGREITLDEAMRRMESFGFQIPDDAYERMEDQIMNGPVYYPLIGQAVFWPIGIAVMAGVVFVVFNVLLGYESTYKHVFAVVVHSCILLAVQLLVVYPMFYLKQSMASPTSLTVFMPFLDEESFVARFLGAFDLFRLWWLANLSIGISVLYKKRMGPIFMSILALYIVIALLYAAATAILSGT